MAWWIWVLIGIFLLAIEFASTTMHVAFFGAGALFVGLLVGLGWRGPLWAQVLVATGVALVSLFVIRPPLMRKLKLNEVKIVDTMIGEHAIASDDLAVQAIGKAEMRGTTWTAQNVGSAPIARGQRCLVERVDGLTIQIRAL